MAEAAPLRVLLVEDNPGDARLIREMLADAAGSSVEIVHADHLSGGLALLIQGSLDAVLLDLSLPDSHGLDTFFQASEAVPSVPIVVLSGSVDEDVALEAVQAGAQDYLVKGRTTGETVSRAIRYAIERKRAAEEQRFLAEAAALLASSLDHLATLRSLADAAVPRLADWCFVDLLVEDGTLHRVAVAQAHPTPTAQLLLGTYELPSNVHDGLPAVLASGHAELVPDLEDDQEHAFPLVAVQGDPARIGAIQDVRPVSRIAVPLIAHAERMGAITFLTAESARRYGPRDLALAEELGQRAALAVANARLYQAAQRAVGLRDHLLASVSHDLRNPLSAIRMHAEALQRRATDDPESAPGWLLHGVSRIQAATQAMDRDIGDLLDAANLQLGRPLSLHREPVDLLALTGQVVAELGTSHDLDIELIGEVPSVEGQWDHRRIEHVLANLLGNAIKYSAGSERVVVTVGLESAPIGPVATVTVQDYGIGIPVADLPHVFTRFFRAGNAVNRFPGTGIGLAGARQVVEQHGGSLQLTSTEGVGTTVVVRLPLVPDGNADASRATTPPVADPTATATRS